MPGNICTQLSFVESKIPPHSTFLSCGHNRNVHTAAAGRISFAAKAIVKKPVAVYIEKVYDDGDFSTLGVGT